jgi:hypothetical protein
MATFRVQALMTTVLFLDIEADSLADAQQQAEEADGGDFTEIEGQGDWLIHSVTLTHLDKDGNVETHPDMQKPIQKYMTCAVSGESCSGRQWHNRDTGFGLCEASYHWLKERGETDASLISNYGIKGIHYMIETVD